MVLTVRPGSMAWLRRARFWSLALLGLVAGHQAVYLAEYGGRFDEAMARTGHAYWLTFALLALVIGGVPIGAALVGLVHLRARLWRAARATERGTRGAGPDEGRSYLGELASLLPRLFPVILLGFMFQENVKSLVAGNGLSGLRVLDLTGLQVLFAITFLIALAGAWLRWREAVLQKRLVAARQYARPVRGHRAAVVAPQWGEIAAIVAHRWLMARRIAGRAPPPAGAA